jgi:hypothetical protein
MGRAHARFCSAASGLAAEWTGLGLEPVVPVRPELADDQVTIPNDERLFRKLRREWVEQRPDGEWQLRTTAFGFNENSVLRASLISVSDAVALQPKDLTGLSSIAAGEVRTGGCSCRVNPHRDPDDHEAHALMLPPLTHRRIPLKCLAQIVQRSAIEVLPQR